MNHKVLIDRNNYTLIEIKLENILDINNQSSKYFMRQLLWRHWNNSHTLHWDQLELEIYSNNKIYYKFARNTPHPPPTLYIIQNNEEFIITSGNYQCISIYNLTRNEFKDYVYPNDDEINYWRGFCPLQYQWNKNTLIITGQVPEGPIEILQVHNVNLNNLTFQEIDWDDYYKEEEEIYNEK